MISWIFGPRIRVHVMILGLVGSAMVRWDGEVRVRRPAAVRSALRAAGRAAGADLLGALERGAQPALMLNGGRLEMPEGLEVQLEEGARLTWLMPMAGG